MHNTLARNGRPSEGFIDKPVLRNAAIDLCCDVWTQRYQAERAKGRGTVSSGIRANEAYRTAMPPLDNKTNIRDFIACTTYGIMIGVICLPTGALLIQSARAAANLSKKAPKKNRNCEDNLNKKKDLQEISHNFAPAA
jgi:hypothetical protein